VGMMERKMKEDGRSPCGVWAAMGGEAKGRASSRNTSLES